MVRETLDSYRILTMYQLRFISFRSGYRNLLLGVERRGFFNFQALVTHNIIQFYSNQMKAINFGRSKGIGRFFHRLLVFELRLRLAKDLRALRNRHSFSCRVLDNRDVDEETKEERAVGLKSTESSTFKQDLV